MSQETLELEGIQLEIDAGLAIIRLNDPDRLNALTTDMAAALSQALQEIAKPRRAIRAVMLTGAGRGFCAGVNLARRSNDASTSKNLPAMSLVETLFHPLIRKLRDIRVPVLAAVNGPCVGIGVSMVLLCDYVIASHEAYFLVPFRNLGSAPDSGLTWLLPRAVGVGRARQMLMRAERIAATQALEWGLANEVVPAAEFQDRARQLADELANGPTVALGVMRSLVFESIGRSFDNQLEMEAQGVAVTSRTKDNVAAMRVFGTKEKPEFTGT
jgi:2-(1,2-epoxy-1,2-dihydrophenyl)acetyl-CoA isomerase